ncbi:DsbE family thiol:disulfide interchange protein [Salinicola avicenniae]|uniref:DsbE family thiol:disulfide interchange protein n=1 Tax=Salinicola avicenniae TaxID=2916836 RepID=UPI002073F55A|nr:MULTISPECIES: DsbE family thiol:disulfide interchange protein [unclassified Salinicola]
MKRRLLLLIPLAIFAVLVAFFYRGLAKDPAARDSALLAKPFPAFELSTLADASQRLDRSLLEGQVTLVNVWGEWCPTCKQEMPQLLELADRGVRLVGVDYKDTRENGRRFLDEYGDPFTVSLFDPEGSLGFDLGVYGAPESFLVDADGVIRYHHTGYITPQDVEQVILPQVAQWQ